MKCIEIILRVVIGLSMMDQMESETSLLETVRPHSKETTMSPATITTLGTIRYRTLIILTQKFEGHIKACIRSLYDGSMNRSIWIDWWPSCNWDQSFVMSRELFIYLPKSKKAPSNFVPSHSVKNRMFFPGEMSNLVFAITQDQWQSNSMSSTEI